MICSDTKKNTCVSNRGTIELAQEILTRFLERHKETHLSNLHLGCESRAFKVQEVAHSYGIQLGMLQAEGPFSVTSWVDNKVYEWDRHYAAYVYDHKSGDRLILDPAVSPCPIVESSWCEMLKMPVGNHPKTLIKE